MIEDKERWNKRFEERPMTAPKPPGFIADNTEQLNIGSVLDIASGDGAAALFLASKGFDVTAMDISGVALTRLSTFATNLDLEVATLEVDLDDTKALAEDSATFDNIVMTHFKPKPEYWAKFVEILRPDGKLLLSTFNLKHHHENGFSRRFCLEENELINIHEQLELVYHKSVERNGSFMDDYVFCRR